MEGGAIRADKVGSYTQITVKTALATRIVSYWNGGAAGGAGTKL